MTELRCNAKKHGDLAEGFLEVKCSSRFCGAAPGVVVIHRFSLLTGGMLETKRFRDPGPDAMKEDRKHGTNDNPVAVRAS